MGDIEAENKRLKEDNTSKSTHPSGPLGPLASYNRDVARNYATYRKFFNPNVAQPSEASIEGALVILTTMFARPIELAKSVTLTDLVNGRPAFRFASEVPTLSSLGLDLKQPEHAFFAKCYMQFPTDPAFCKDGIPPQNSNVISLPPGSAFPPRASILKKMPKNYKKIFRNQTASSAVSDVSNSRLSLESNGGLYIQDPLPEEVHHLFFRFLNTDLYKNPTVPLFSQFLTYIQNGLSKLDEVLLKYKSPVYKQCPLIQRSYKNGRADIIKNTDHPVYDKYDSLLKRIHFDTAYATTRLTFAWKGFYMPNGKVSSLRDKYAFFSFVYSTDLILGALPLWPHDMSSQYQLDRSDPMRHYTLDNVRWLDKSDNMANKPSDGKPKGPLFRTTKQVVELLHNVRRANMIQLETLGALMKGQS